ncbi:haloacid dehalogenase-like hydrolase [Luteibacter aegosomaticola]|uniref:HAD family hydrolase n=1 Tax=Luteibacter aegosomaticola TaxID=2911538 RepID=UPI001FF7A589|nr:haloacid dehalogenase-like hydrolase [Luteibacter aegosomaticola]UPG91343.1 haloacid dehalogenase-like hydrolase [Luteibacter aegosomaticola]
MLTYRWEPRHTIATFVALVMLVNAGRAHVDPSSDPLPSWNDGATKTAIVAFVAGAASEGDAGYIAPVDRVAVFDMDGTLMPEKPLPGAVLPLAADVKGAVAKRPALANEPGVAAFLKGDIPALVALGQAGLAQVTAAAIDGRTTDEVADGMAREAHAAVNARWGTPYPRLAYRPMLELLRYLEANGFETWICSGSPIAYTRGIARDAFGIPPDRVIGSALATRVQEREGRVVLVYTGKVDQVVDREGKPPAIYRAIGRRPAFVGGNVGGVGDVSMMRYAMDRGGPAFALLVNHDDAAREFAYAEKGGESLAAAVRYHFHIASIRGDWNTVFDPSVNARPPTP